MEKCTVLDFEGFEKNLCLAIRSDICSHNSVPHQNHHSTQTNLCYTNILLIKAIVKRVSVGQTTGVVNRDSVVLWFAYANSFAAFGQSTTLSLFTTPVVWPTRTLFTIALIGKMFSEHFLVWTEWWFWWVALSRAEKSVRITRHKILIRTFQIRYCTLFHHLLKFN